MASTVDQTKRAAVATIGSGPPRLNVSEIRRPETFSALRREWNALVDADPRATIFQTWEFQYHGWTIVSDTVSLNLLVVRDQTGRMVACAPFGVQRLQFGPLSLRCLCFACLKYSDYSDLIVDPAYAHGAMEQIAGWIERKSTDWDLVCLQPVRDDSWLLGGSPSLISYLPSPFKVSPSNTAPFLGLSDDWPSYETALSRGRAKSIRRRVRQVFERHDGRFHPAEDPEALDRALAHLIDLHQKRMHEKNEIGAFANPRARGAFGAIVRALYERGMAQVHSLQIGQRTIANLCTFQYRGTVLDYQSGFDPEFARLSPGNVITALRINEALANRDTLYDFLIGDEPYKYIWAGGQRRLMRLEIFTSRWRHHPYRAWQAIRRRLSRSALVRKWYRRLGTS